MANSFHTNIKVERVRVFVCFTELKLNNVKAASWTVRIVAYFTSVNFETEELILEFMNLVVLLLYKII